MRALVFLFFVKILSAKVYFENVDDTSLFDPACVDNNSNMTQETSIGCVCGIFLTGQFNRPNSQQPKGDAVVSCESPDKFPCTPVGNKMCMNKCVVMISERLASSWSLICKNINRDCYKEKAYLFFKNCKNKWINTNLSSGRDYCCKNHIPYRCSKTIERPS